MDYSKIINSLQIGGLIVDGGLDHEEIASIEDFYCIKFPPDLKELLSVALPISEGFCNWRDKNENNVNKLRDRLNWPVEGLVFEVEYNNFWYPGWGKKPERVKECIEICKNAMMRVPKLIPIYSHRYIPTEPYEAGNPIFSVYQSDIVYYGQDLSSYLLVEFGLAEYGSIDVSSIKKIRFWSDLAG